MIILDELIYNSDTGKLISNDESLQEKFNREKKEGRTFTPIRKATFEFLNRISNKASPTKNVLEFVKKKTGKNYQEIMDDLVKSMEWDSMFRWVSGLVTQIGSFIVSSGRSWIKIK